jgi:hypothetical protein
LMEFAPFHVFKYCVKRYDGDYNNGKYAHIDPLRTF